MTDWRALCKELVDELNGYKVAHPNHETELIDRARAALAQPEPEASPAPAPAEGEVEKAPAVTEVIAWLRTEAEIDDGFELTQSAAYQRRAADLLEQRQAAPVPMPASEHPDERNPECVKAWPECWEGGYDPRCCRFPKSCSCEVSHALPSEWVAVPLKERPNFVAGYKAGLNDGRLECQARAKDYSITDLEPVAWMYRGEPDFDGSKWRENWLVTLDRKLAEQKAKPDKPIPLFRAGG